MNPLTLIGPRTIMVLLVLTALEFGLAQGGYGHWTATEQSERYGWRMLPDQDAWSRDLDVPERINTMGFRDREWAPAPAEKDTSVYRVAVVGNSMTYGTSVAVEETWPRVLEQRLAADFEARGDPRAVVVMNFAVQGYVYEQMARVWEDHVQPYRPDLFIVPVHPHDIVPMAPAHDDAEYDFRTTVLRSATFDWLNKRVINRWVPPVPPSPAARAAARRHQQLDAAIGERPFSRDAASFWVEQALGRPEQRDESGVVLSEAMTGLLPLAEEQLAAWGGKLALVSLPRWRQAFEPGLLSAASKLAPLAARADNIFHVDPMPGFHGPMQPVVAEITPMGDKAWQTDDMGKVRWTDAEGRSRPGDDIPSADQSLWFLDDVGHYSAAGHRLLGEAVFEQLRAAGAF